MNRKIVIATVAGAAVLAGAALAQSTSMSPTGSGSVPLQAPSAYGSDRSATANAGSFAADTGSGSIPGEMAMAGERG
jgi:hypothetical protein